MSEASWGILEGDSAVILDDLAEYANTIDALVTDPPAGIGFMGKAWDGDRGGREEWVRWLEGVMRSCLRLMKPGAHGLVWALPRTSHWTATALENAGFEVRDVITHHFGTGFPKSLDVSKAIDKATGAEREILGRDEMRYARLKNQIDGYVDMPAGMQSRGRSADITAPATEAAKQWSGWGTALKPATEHWILVRKPLVGTVAANVQEYGTGAINIDASRIAGAVQAPGSVRKERHFDPLTERDGHETTPPPEPHAAGRWPANLILSHDDACETAQDGSERVACAPGCPVAELDAQSGISKSSGGTKGPQHDRDLRMGRTSGEGGNAGGLGDTGGASRFFYCAKPSTRERNEGLKDIKNVHPTVKSQALMTYLVRLITPRGGLVLDPFAGSGSTGVACVTGGWEFLGIEQSPEFAAIARARIEAVAPQSPCAVVD